MVLQDTRLFGSPTAGPRSSEADILEAAKTTCVDRVVKSLPQGYDTVVAAGGAYAALYAAPVAEV